MSELKRFQRLLKPGAFAQKSTGPHPWRGRSATRKKDEQQALDELTEIERTHKQVTGSGKRAGSKEAGQIRRRRGSTA